MILTKVNNNKKRKLTPGEYDALVESVEYSSDYVEGQALEIKYVLTDSQGCEYKYREIFINDTRNQRTFDFFRYLQENGISTDNLENFAGCKEKISLKKNAVNGRTYLTIVERKFVKKE